MWARTLSARHENASARLRDRDAWAQTRGAPISLGGSSGAGPFSSECPFVVHDPASGYWYLFRTQRYTPDGGQTSVYASRDPSNFGVGDGSADAYLVARLPVAAPEVVMVEGELWIVALTEALDGMRVARLELAPSSPSAGTQTDESVEAA